MGINWPNLWKTTSGYWNCVLEDGKDNGVEKMAIDEMEKTLVATNLAIIVKEVIVEIEMETEKVAIANSAIVMAEIAEVEDITEGVIGIKMDLENLVNVSNFLIVAIQITNLAITKITIENLVLLHPTIGSS